MCGVVITFFRRHGITGIFHGKFYFDAIADARDDGIVHFFQPQSISVGKPIVQL